VAGSASADGRGPALAVDGAFVIADKQLCEQIRNDVTRFAVHGV